MGLTIRGLALLLFAWGCTGCDDNQSAAPDLAGRADLGPPRHDLAGDSGAFNGPKTGVVSATSSTFTIPGLPPPMMFSIAGASASFDEGQSNCTQELKGPCIITFCNNLEVDHANAGTVSIFAPARSTPLALTVAPDGTYSMFSDDMGKLWEGTGNEMVRFTAAGAEVPMFDSSVVAPSQLTITSPTPPPAGPPGSPVMGIPRNAALTFAWTGSSPGDATILLLPMDTSAVSSVACTFMPAAGTGTIPPEVLGRLPAGMATLVASSTSTKKITAGAWTVSLVAVTGAILASDGSGYTVPVTLQ